MYEHKMEIGTQIKYLKIKVQFLSKSTLLLSTTDLDAD